MSYHSTSCGQTPLERPSYYPLGYPMQSGESLHQDFRKKWNHYLVNEVDNPQRLFNRVTAYNASHTLVIGQHHGLMARGGHGLPKFLGPAMPYLSTPYREPPLKWPYSCFRGGCPQGGWPANILYPLGHPTPYAYGSCPVSGHGVFSIFWIFFQRTPSLKFCSIVLK